MEDFYINNTFHDEINTSVVSSFSDHPNNTHYDDFLRYFDHLTFIDRVITSITVCIGLSLTLVAIYAVFSLVRSDHVAPIYVINLLISDLIQLCCMIPWTVPVYHPMIYCSFTFSLMVSVGFMVCIALERYLVIAFPLWYRCRRTIKTSVLLCVMVWAVSLVLTLFAKISSFLHIVLLLPFPLLIFFLGGTLKALSASRVPADEKRRIVGILVLVLLTYTLLFLPYIICEFTPRYNYTFFVVSFICLQLNPLADLALYVFMRRGTIDKILASVCVSRIDSKELSTLTSTA